MTKEKFSVRGAQALLGTAFAYAFTGILVRAMGSMWGDKAQTAVRFTLVAVCMLLYGYFRKTKASIPRAKLPYAVGLGLAFALIVLFFTFSIQKTTISNSLFTFYATNMAVSFLAGTFVLKETVSKSKVVALVFALAGLSLYAGAVAAGSLGIIFGVLAGVSGGLSNLLSKQLVGIDRNAVLRVQYAVGALFTSLVTWISGDQVLRAVSWHGVVITLVFALILIVAGNLSLYGFQHFDVNIGTVITSMELVFGTLLAWLFYREVPAPHELLGGILIFVGSALSSLDLEQFRSKKPA